MIPLCMEEYDYAVFVGAQSLQKPRYDDGCHANANWRRVFPICRDCRLQLPIMVRDKSASTNRVRIWNAAE